MERALLTQLAEIALAGMVVVVLLVHGKAAPCWSGWRVFAAVASIAFTAVIASAIVVLLVWFSI